MLVIHETIPRSPARALFRRDQMMRRFNCPYHRHPEFEVVRIDESRGRLLAGDHAGSFGPGEIYVFAGNFPHGFINHSDTLRARSRFIQFDSSLLADTLRPWPELRHLEEFPRQARRGIRYSPENARKASDALDRIFESDGPDRIPALLQLVIRLTETDGETLAGTGYDLRPPDRHIQRLEAALRRIHGEPADAPDIPALAAETGMSVSAFHRFFRKRMGCTPGNYILNLRFAGIARRLMETEDSISEIAFDAGFNNLSNFNRQFRHRFDCSPREYRSRLQ